MFIECLLCAKDFASCWMFMVSESDMLTELKNWQFRAVVSNFLKTGVQNVFYIVHQHTHMLPIPNKFHNTMLILYYLLIWYFIFNFISFKNWLYDPLIGQDLSFLKLGKEISKCLQNEKSMKEKSRQLDNTGSLARVIRDLTLKLNPEEWEVEQGGE